MDVKLLGLVQEYSFVDERFSNKIKLQLPNGSTFLAEIDIDTALLLTGSAPVNTASNVKPGEVPFPVEDNEEIEDIFPSEAPLAPQEVEYDPGIRLESDQQTPDSMPIPGWHNPVRARTVQKNEFGYPIVSGSGLVKAPNNPNDEDGLESV